MSDFIPFNHLNYALTAIKLHWGVIKDCQENPKKCKDGVHIIENGSIKHEYPEYEINAYSVTAKGTRKKFIIQIYNDCYAECYAECNNSIEL